MEYVIAIYVAILIVAMVKDVRRYNRELKRYTRESKASKYKGQDETL